MAGSSEDERRRHSRCPADLRDGEPPEEGELVPGCDDDSDVNTEDYYNNHDNNYSSSDTDETTSDCNYARPVVPASYGGAAAAAANNNSNGNASSSPVAAPVLACPICGKEFRSRKAVCGHMKVHQQGTTIGRHEQQGIGKEKDRGIKRTAAVMGSWGGTGKRGCSGCWSKPASPNNGNARSESDQSMAIVVANPKTVLQPMPLAYAMPVPMASATPNPSSAPMASGTPNPSSKSNPISSTMTNASDESSSKPMRSDAMDTTVVAVAGAAGPRTDAAADVHLDDDTRAPPSPPPPAEVHATPVHQQPIDPPSPASPTPPPADAEEERVQQLPPVHDHPHPIAPPPPLPGRQNPNGYTCKQCGVWFAMHQGLGGHMAGHKTRELAAAPCRRDGDAAKPEKVHVCRICGAVFPAGVQLGGHMRKHYTGAPIVPKKKPRPVVVVQPLPLLPPPADQSALEPAPSPAVPGRVILFGVNIAAAAQEEGSSATQAQASSASTGGEQ